MAYNTDFKITSKWNIALSRQLKFLMLAAELSSRGKRKTLIRKLRAEKARDSFRGIENLYRSSSRRFFTGNCDTF